MLYVVSTPIGNLGDMSQRAIDTLKSCTLIAAEDTRHSAVLKQRFGIDTPMVSYQKHNERARAAQLIERMQSENIDVALITDAGTPCISDPGQALVEAAHAAGIAVTAVPGPSAMVTALSLCGYELSSFSFYGFLSRKAGEREAQLSAIKTSGLDVCVLYESPHRVSSLLEQIEALMPGAHISAFCELTKLYERIFRGTPMQVIAQIEQSGAGERGEYVIVLKVPPHRPSAEQQWSCAQTLIALSLKGLARKDCRTQLKKMGFNHDDIFEAERAVRDFLQAQG